jgi:hypothetical protein
MTQEKRTNTVEELFQKAGEFLAQNVRTQVILTKLAERGYTPQTQEQRDELLKVANQIGQGIASGEIDPIPMSELEETGTLSKHASTKAQEDILAFAPDITIDVNEIDPQVKSASAVVLLAG